jgi:hypothetical protein
MNRMHGEAAAGAPRDSRAARDEPAASRLLAICEDCGKKYRVDASKIRSHSASFTCRACGHPIVVARPRFAVGADPDDALAGLEETLSVEEALAARPAAPAEAAAAAARPERLAVRGLGRFGWRIKALCLFFLLPAAVLTGAGLVFQKLVEHRLFRLSQESRRIVGELSEENLAAAARSLAQQTGAALAALPPSGSTEADRDRLLRAVFLASPPRIGTAFVYERPGADAAWRARLHADERWLPGTDLSTLREGLGAHFEGFWALLTGVQEGRMSRGFCFGRDRQGKFREEFMACAPVPGTQLAVGVAAGIEEFSAPAARLDERIAELRSDLRALAGFGLGGVLLLVGVVLAAGGLKLADRVPLELSGPAAGGRRRPA